MYIKVYPFELKRIGVRKVYNSDTISVYTMPAGIELIIDFDKAIELAQEILKLAKRYKKI